MGTEILAHKLAQHWSKQVMLDKDDEMIPKEVSLPGTRETQTLAQGSVFKSAVCHIVCNCKKHNQKESTGQQH